MTSRNFLFLLCLVLFQDIFIIFRRQLCVMDILKSVKGLTERTVFEQKSDNTGEVRHTACRRKSTKGKAEGKSSKAKAAGE